MRTSHPLPLILAIVPFISGTYQPGTPGAPWTKEEIDIVRDKVTCMQAVIQGKTSCL